MIPRLLVTLGGSDPDNVTVKVLEALKGHQGPLGVTVVVGTANRHKDAVLKAAQEMPSCEVVVGATNMAELMHEADAAVTAAGQTTLEALFMELPTVNIMIAENQRLISRYLTEEGLSQSLTADFKPENFLSALRSTMDGRDIQKKKLAEVAGRIGTRSAADTVACSRFKDFSIVETAADDIISLYELANDPEVRMNSLSRETIAWDTHVAWFERQMAEPLQKLYTVKDRYGGFMGQLRFDCREAGKAVISLSIVKAARGCGNAVSIIRNGVDMLFEMDPGRIVESVVRKDNPASLKSFEKAGFKKISEDADTVILHLKKAEQNEY